MKKKKNSLLKKTEAYSSNKKYNLLFCQLGVITVLVLHTIRCNLKKCELNINSEMKTGLKS